MDKNEKSSRKKVLFSSEFRSKNVNVNLSKKGPSLIKFLKGELTRDYLLEHDKERYSAKREKVYSFMRIPLEVEKYMLYGFMQCTDSFLFVCTFLPLRVLLALWSLISRPFYKCFGILPKSDKILKSAEICDLLRVLVLILSSIVMCYIDPNVLYHLIKSQSVIKLYLFYNMLEVGDRLFSSIGQDTIDALFWTATEPRGKKREHLGVIPHLIFALVYIILHSCLVLFQATTLNVGINSSNKILLTIMMSNNFVELKGSVFKKFDKNNLFQVSCSDVRERFHLTFLLFIVIMQTMKEYSWKLEQFWLLLPDCIVVLGVEFVIDWIKHAFVTKFNELPLDVYKDYTISLAYDLAETRQKHAFTDCCDLVARRMGFIPIPLTVVMVRILVSTLNIKDLPSVIIFLVAYLCIITFKIFNSIVLMGKACDLIETHKQEKVASPGVTRSSIGKKLFAEVATSPYHVFMPDRSSSPHVESFDSGEEQLPKELGSSAIFENSTVDLKSATLNDELLKIETNEDFGGSFNDINEELVDNIGNEDVLKRAESEPAQIGRAHV